MASSANRDLAMTILFAVIAGAIIGAAAGLAQNRFGWRSGFLVPALGGTMGAFAALYYRARQRRRAEGVSA